jgi:hypothetical protein
MILNISKHIRPLYGVSNIPVRAVKIEEQLYVISSWESEIVLGRVQQNLPVNVEILTDEIVCVTEEVIHDPMRWIMARIKHETFQKIEASVILKGAENV